MPELLLVICLSLTLAGLAGLPLRPALDRHATRAARDSFATAVARTRSAAVVRGGAILVVEPHEGRASTRTPAGEPVGEPINFGTRYRVELHADGAAAESIELFFDALGIGRVTSRTFRFRRGGAEARLTLSAYGRVRLW